MPYAFTISENKPKPAVYSLLAQQVSDLFFCNERLLQCDCCNAIAENKLKPAVYSLLTLTAISCVCHVAREHLITKNKIRLGACAKQEKV